MPRSLMVTLAIFVLALAGCGDVNDPDGATPSPSPQSSVAAATPTPSPVPTPTTAAIATSQLFGLAVLAEDVTFAAEEAPNAPPEAWFAEPDAPSFPRAFSHADWTLAGPIGRSGTTGADGGFVIADLPPGDYRLTLSRTLNGTLIEATAAFSIGADGDTDVLIQIDRHGARSAAEHTSGGKIVRSIEGPDAARITVEDDRVVAITHPSGRLVDPDGDGRFVDPGCVAHSLWFCDANESCGDGLRCQCTASCPSCEDCGPSICAPPMGIAPYRCADDGACSRPGDVCTCVSSCPDCRDCAMSVCVPSCDPVGVASVEVEGAERITIGQRTSLRAFARFDDGSGIDVTTLARWESSDSAVATVDSWGNVSGRSLGSAELTAVFGYARSEPHTIEVVDRGSVSQVEIYVQDCIVPIARPDGSVDASERAPILFPFPSCRDVVRLGNRTTLIAFANFTDGSFEVVTERVQWSVTPADVGRIDRGAFHALAVGEADIHASLDGVDSNTLRLRVVERGSVAALHVYPLAGVLPHPLPVGGDDPTFAMPPIFCPDCWGTTTILVGDRAGFQAMAQFDTGEWEDVTEIADWQVGDGGIASFDAPGTVVALAPGSTYVQAGIGDVSSDPVGLDVVAESTLLSLHVYQEGSDRVVARGEDAYFRAWASFDVGFSRDVTDEVAWHSSDPDVGTFAAPGTFTGAGAGDAEIWASLDGVASPRQTIRVFATSTIEYCDPSAMNRSVWSDAFNRVVLESDCREYTPPDVAHLRFTVTEWQRPTGVFAPCLDLYVHRDGRKVRTIREEGCGDPWMAPGAPGEDAETLRFQLEAFWDLKDDAGDVVEPGVYTIYGRFYLYFDPVVRLQVVVTAPDGLIPCRVNRCGNGCGYVHACGGAPPLACPEICRELCECPAGWGITPAGGCEPCAQECCAPGEACADILPPCEPADACCAPGQECAPNQAPCPVECCPANARCTPDIPPCEPGPTCCPPGALCGPLDLPPCVEDCCPPGQACIPGLRPCESTIPFPERCVVSGCSGQICAAVPMASTCEFVPEYACYRDAECAPQANGACGWTQTEALHRCISEARSH